MDRHPSHGASSAGFMESEHHMFYRALIVVLLIAMSDAARGTPPPTTRISEGRADASPGIVVYDVACPQQSGPTQVRVAVPGDFHRGMLYPVVYVLPVEAGNESKYG